MSGIYEQLNPRHMHLYTGYMDTFLADKQKITNPMEGVTITNNGLWYAYPDPEFKFEPENGLLNRECIKNFFEEARSERRVTFITGTVGAQNMHEAFDRYLQEQTIDPVMSTELIDELLEYTPNIVRLQPRNGITVTREFETEQEAIAYLDSLSQETTDTEYEENTDIV